METALQALGHSVVRCDGERALASVLCQGDVDVVFVPVDGSKHILDYQQADGVIAKTKANIAIPHHYLVPETTYYTSTLLPATEWVETHENTLLDGPSVMITKADVEGKQGHVYYFGSHNIVTAEK